MTSLEVIGIVCGIFTLAALSLYFHWKYPPPVFSYLIPEWPYMHYTPQQYLEDIRNHLWECNKSMTPEQRAALKSVPIIYKALSQMPMEVIARRDAQRWAKTLCIPVQKIYGYHMGATDKLGYEGGPGARELFVFGCDHLHDQNEIAKTLVHELGHVISKQGHGPKWAEAVQGLGLCEEPYPGEARSFSKKPVQYGKVGPKVSGPWLDKELEAYVSSRPKVDWGNVDADAEQCLMQALRHMNGG
jgi:hypothetical protein